LAVQNETVLGITGRYECCWLLYVAAIMLKKMNIIFASLKRYNSKYALFYFFVAYRPAMRNCACAAHTQTQ